MPKICIGMFRPLYHDLRAKLEKQDWRSFPCRCSGEGGFEFYELVDHWLLGHFDEPVYKEIEEDTLTQGKEIKP